MSLRAEVADHSLRSRLLENSPRAQIFVIKYTSRPDAPVARSLLKNPSDRSPSTDDFASGPVAALTFSVCCIERLLYAEKCAVHHLATGVLCRVHFSVTWVIQLSVQSGDLSGNRKGERSLRRLIDF